MADETENQEQQEQPVEETVSAPEGPVAPAGEPEPGPAPPAEETIADAEAAPNVEAAAAEAEAPPAEPEPKKKRKRLPRAQRRQRTKTKRERPAERATRPRITRPERERPRGRRQERRGVVVSNAADKTIVVKVDTVKAHPRYKKVVRRSTKFHAHDERNEAKVGDVVRIVETRPLAKTKNWRLAEIVEVAQ